MCSSDVTCSSHDRFGGSISHVNLLVALKPLDWFVSECQCLLTACMALAAKRVLLWSQRSFPSKISWAWILLDNGEIHNNPLSIGYPWVPRRVRAAVRKVFALSQPDPATLNPVSKPKTHEGRLVVQCVCQFNQCSGSSGRRVQPCSTHPSDLPSLSNGPTEALRARCSLFSRDSAELHPDMHTQQRRYMRTCLQSNHCSLKPEHMTNSAPLMPLKLGRT